MAAPPCTARTTLLRIQNALLRFQAVLGRGEADLDRQIRNLSTRQLIYVENGAGNWNAPLPTFAALDELRGFRLPRATSAPKPVPNSVSNIAPADADAAAIKRSPPTGLEDRISWLHCSWQRPAQAAPADEVACRMPVALPQPAAGADAAPSGFNPAPATSDVTPIRPVTDTGLEERTSWLYGARQRPAQAVPDDDVAHRTPTALSPPAAGADAAVTSIATQRDAITAYAHVPHVGDGVDPIEEEHPSRDQAQQTITDAPQLTGNAAEEPSSVLLHTSDQLVARTSDDDSGYDADDGDIESDEWGEVWRPLTKKEQDEADAAFDRQSREIEEFEERSAGEFFDNRITVLPPTALAKERVSTTESLPANSPGTSLLDGIVAARERRARLMAEDHDFFVPPRERADASTPSLLDGGVWQGAITKMLHTHADGQSHFGSESDNNTDLSDDDADWATERESNA